MSPVAVSTLVLAAMAVSDPAIACPLGREVDLDQPVLSWQLGARTRDPLVAARPIAARPINAKLAKPPRVTLRTAVGDGAAVVRTLAHTEVLCGRGRGEMIVRVQHGQATISTTGLDPIMADCVRIAIERVRFTRVADGTLAHVAIELEP